MEEKVENAKRVIAKAVKDYPRIAVACSFGKDSMVTVHLAREVNPKIKIFSIMTQYKPEATFEYLRLMNFRMNLDVMVYIVASTIPEALRGLDWGPLGQPWHIPDVRLLPEEEFNEKNLANLARTDKELYESNPDECCKLLKVEPTRVAVSNLDAWITGLRSTEGKTRVDYQEVEKRGDLMKINPILDFTEAEIWKYMATGGIEPHPWYGLGYRSLGCAPCSSIGGDSERDGRWRGTSKCGGECGIHTQELK